MLPKYYVSLGFYVSEAGKQWLKQKFSETWLNTTEKQLPPSRLTSLA